MKLPERPRRSPSLKNPLIDLNLDVDTICRQITLPRETGKLSDLEYYSIVLEDRRFLFHSGFDYKSFAREIYKLVLGSRNGGASTIDMQFVRVCTGRYERTLQRKLREVILSYLLQWQATKIAILRSYLQIAYFGSGLNGCEAAAQKIFARPASSLSGYDAAFVAAMLVYPRALEPNADWYSKVNRRALYGLKVGSKIEERFKKIGIR